MKPAFALACLAVPAPSAQAQVMPLSGDSRVETLLYEAGRQYRLRSALGASATIILAPLESIRSVTVGDPGALEVTVSPQGDSVVVRPVRPIRATTLAIRSDLRSYDFRVEVGAPNDVVYALRFGFAAAPALPPLPRQSVMPPHAPGEAPTYRFKGDKALRPVTMRHDGQRTYIDWAPDQAIPAVFALSATGSEETVDGYMRDGIFTIDRVHDRLIFRLGKAMARAERIIPGTRRGRR